MSQRLRLRKRLAAVVLVTACTGACVLAEPVSDLPRPAQQRPTIVRSSVVPSPNLVLGTFPDKFIVPVELADPTVTFQWSAFVDFDSTQDTGLQLFGDSVFETASLSGRTRVLEIPIPAPSDLDRCHVIEVFVALQLESTTSPRGAHSPKQGGPGGDGVTWFYSPGGDLAGCPTLVIDAGADAESDGGGDGGTP
jgi:hypothetical protein